MNIVSFDFARCVYMVIYTQTDVLMEDQAEIIIKTKNSLGIDHLDAAILHLEVLYCTYFFFMLNKKLERFLV